MFGIGFTELLLVLVVALLVLGPDKLPEVARTMAKAYNELRRTGLDLKRTVEGTVKDMDLSSIVKDGLSSMGDKTDRDKKKEKTVSKAEPEAKADETPRKAT